MPPPKKPTRAVLTERLMMSGVPLATIVVKRMSHGKGCTLSFAIKVTTQEKPTPSKMRMLTNALRLLEKTEINKVRYLYKEDLFAIHLTSWTDHQPGS